MVKTMNKNHDEYYLLKEKLEELIWALKGQCNDIDCDKYMYKDLLKKRHNPILKHSYSCIISLKREKEAVMRLLSLKKFRRYRYKKCEACKKSIDSLGKQFKSVILTRPVNFNGKKFFELDGIDAHKQCESKKKIPEAWKKR